MIGVVLLIIALVFIANMDRPKARVRGLRVIRSKGGCECAEVVLQLVVCLNGAVCSDDDFWGCEGQNSESNDEANEGADESCSKFFDELDHNELLDSCHYSPCFFREIWCQIG